MSFWFIFMAQCTHVWSAYTIAFCSQMVQFWETLKNCCLEFHMDCLGSRWMLSTYFICILRHFYIVHILITVWSCVILPCHPSSIHHFKLSNNTSYNILYQYACLFFKVYVIAFSAIVRTILKSIKNIPYTVFLLVLGACFGLISSRVETLKAYTSIVNMNPHTLLYVFLPVLIFESAYAMEAHTFFKSSIQIITLAVPGLCKWNLTICGIIQLSNVKGKSLDSLGCKINSKLFSTNSINL